jgi:hypothetical protein
LLHKPDVAAHEVAYVIDSRLHHDQPVKPHAESEPGPLLRVNTAGPKYIGMDKSAAQEFNPP